jgi:hypothetical protein
MPAMRSPARLALFTERQVDGLVLAPIERSPWAALRALREAMLELRRLGIGAQVVSVVAIGGDGRVVASSSTEAALFALVYRFEP